MNNQFTRFFSCFILGISLLSCVKELEKDDLDSGLTGEVMIDIAATSSSNIVGESGTTQSPSGISTSNFKVSIENPKGLLLKEWARADQMPGKLKFGVGKFVMKATGGDSTSQGFDDPSYFGSQKFEVFHNEQTQIKVSCRHSKALVSVRPNPGFESYYKDYRVEVKSDYSPLNLTYLKGENRIGYFVPRTISAKLYVTRMDDTKLQSDLIEIPNVKAADHFILTLDNSKNAGEIEFNISLEGTNDRDETHIIPLKTINGKMPYFVPTGFDLANPSIFSGEGQPYTAKLLIKAGATIDQCVAKVSSGYLISKGLPAEFDFADTDNNVQLANTLKALGIKWSNGMRGASMAEIDFTDFIHKLPADAKKEMNHILSITVRDYINRTTPVLPIRFAIQPPYIAIDKVVSVTKVGATEDLDIVLDGYMEYATISNIKGIHYSTNGSTFNQVDPSKISYIEQQNGYFTIKIDNLAGISSEFMTMRIVAGTNVTGNEHVSDAILVQIKTPTFVIQQLPNVIDGSVDVKVDVSNTDNVVDFTDSKLAVYANNQGYWEMISNTGTYFGNVKTFHLTNLSPCSRIRIRVKYDNKYSSDNDVTFTTAGFSFEDIWTSMTENNIQSGGKYGGGWGGGLATVYTDKLPVTVMESSNSPWATVNQKTANYSGSSFTANPKNTWFIVPSTKQIAGSSGNGVEIRSVAFSHGGIIAGDNIAGAWSGATKKEDVAPPTFPESNKAAGKLFLGDYNVTFNGGAFTETYNYKKFKLHSRPVSFTGKYKFQQYDGDKASIKVILYGIDVNGNEQIVGEGKFVADKSISVWSAFSVDIAYYNTLKVSSYTIVCSSSDNENNIKLNLNDRTNCVALGNILSVDDFNLAY